MELSKPVLTGPKILINSSRLDRLGLFKLACREYAGGGLFLAEQQQRKKAKQSLNPIVVGFSCSSSSSSY